MSTTRCGIGYDIHRLGQNRKLILGGVEIPYLLGLEHPVQIAPMTASASDLVMLAVLAAGDAEARQQRQSARV